MSSFLSIKNMPKRNAIVQHEHHRGSMSRELYLRLKKHIRNGHINVHKAPITQISGDVISIENDSAPYQQITVVTGFERDFMSQPLIKQLIQNYDAPINEYNYPVISEELERVPNLFVAGCSADLELGPFGRDVMDGRKAAERIK